MIYYGKFKGMTNNDKAKSLLDIYMYCLNHVKRKYIEQDHFGPFQDFYKFSTQIAVMLDLGYKLILAPYHLTHWGQVTHICGSKLTIIGSNNGSSPGRHQAIMWTNDGVLLIRPLGANFGEI